MKKIKELKNGIFSISLDFELYWGVMSRVTIPEYEENLNGTREGIDRTLEIFNKYEIHATWATVGFLFYKNKDDLLTDIPQIKPTYEQIKYDSYRRFDFIESQNEDTSLYFALPTIKKISEVPFQEIATHTFSHYFCLENGQKITQFDEDIKAAVLKAKTLGFNIKSIVFPRNQYNEDYLTVCKKYGVDNIRGNPTSILYGTREPFIGEPSP